MALRRPLETALRALVGTRDHLPRPAPPKSQLERVEHDCEVEKARRCRHVGEVRDPEPVSRLRVEAAVEQVAGRPDLLVLERRALALAMAHAGKALRRHRALDTLAADMDAFGRRLGMDAKRAIGALRRRADPRALRCGGHRRDGRRRDPPASTVHGWSPHTARTLGPDLRGRAGRGATRRAAP